MLAFLSEWTSFIILALQVLFLWSIWSLKQTFVSRRDFSEITARVDALEYRVEGLPSIKEVNQILLKMEEMRGDFKAMQEKMDGLSGSQKRLENGLDRLEERIP